MNKTFKYNLGKLRTKNSLSQEKLAEKMSVARQTISKWENGDTYPSTKHILMLSEILNCEVGDLVGEEQTKNKKIFLGSTVLAITIMILVFVCGFVTATAIMYFCNENGDTPQCEYLESMNDRKVGLW